MLGRVYLLTYKKKGGRIASYFREINSMNSVELEFGQDVFGYVWIRH